MFTPSNFASVHCWRECETVWRMESGQSHHWSHEWRKIPWINEKHGEFVLHCAWGDRPGVTVALRHCSRSMVPHPTDGRYETSGATVRLLSVFIKASCLSDGPRGSKRRALTLYAAAGRNQSSAGATLKQISTWASFATCWWLSALRSLFLCLFGYFHCTQWGRKVNFLGVHEIFCVSSLQVKQPPSCRCSSTGSPTSSQWVAARRRSFQNHWHESPGHPHPETTCKNSIFLLCFCISHHVFLRNKFICCHVK